MKPKTFIDQLDESRIVSAIAAAEQKSSGEIRIYVSNQNVADVFAAARLQFARMGMEKTRHRNGVLLFFAPKTQRFAIVGDAGVHEKCGDDYWQQITAQMTESLKGGQFTQAVLKAVNKVGETLAEHFPRAPDDQNELPDSIVRDD